MITEQSPIVVDARSILETLGRNADNLQLALEADAAKRRIAKEARQNYEAAEAEFIAEIYPTLPGSNKESREAAKDAFIVKARTTGTLARAWSLMNAAAYDAEDAKTALEQEQTAFSAVKHAADLVGSILKAIA